MRSVHIGLREHRCPVCARAFGKKENLKRHFVLRHPTAKPYFAAQQCRYCPAAFPTRPALEAHWVAVHRLNNKLRCDQCEKTFSRNFRLQNHRRRHHHSPGAPEEAAAGAGAAALAAAVKPFPCPFCECTYKQVSQLKMHLRIHSMEGDGGDEEGETVDGPAEGQEGEETSMGRKKTKEVVKVEPVENGNNAEVLNAGDKEGGEGEGEGKEVEEEEEEEASEDTSDTDDTDDDDDDDFVAEDDDEDEEDDEDDDSTE